MRVIGIALVLSTLCAACALQPAGRTDDVSLGSGASQPSNVAELPAQTTLQAETSGTALSAPVIPPAKPCSGPPCDPEPQPWGGNPPFLPTPKH